MTAPVGETTKERRRQWYVGIATVIALLSIVGNVFLTSDDIRNANANRAALEQRDSRIVQLERQHGADIQNESQLLQSLQKVDHKIIIPYVQQLDTSLNAVCAKLGAPNCMITFPVAPAATTTTTTVPSTVSHPPATPAPHASPAATTSTVPARPGHSGSAPGHNKSHH